MRIAYLIAGAGGMYCGSCLRDNRLAATLIAQGRNVVPIPLYTPIRTDEKSVFFRRSEHRVFYGGINVYLQQRSAFFRHLPGWLGRVLDAPAVLRGAMQLAGDTRGGSPGIGALTVSVLQGEHGAQLKELSKLVDGLRAIKPDIVHLPNLMFVGLAGALKAALDVAVLCTLTGEDIFLNSLSAPFRQEALNLIRERGRNVDGFVAVSNYYAAFATKHFDLPQDRVHVVRMGIRVEDFAEPARPVADPALPAAEPFTIGYLARVCPEKGLANLCEAFAILRRSGRKCRLRAAGYLGRGDRAYLHDVCRYLRGQGVEEAFEYVGEVDRAGKAKFLRSLHMLSVPTVHPEAKGLYVLEAMAAGVPVVQPRHGSFPEIVEATGGGLLYDPTGTEGLAGAIAQLMDDPALRDRLADQGRSAVRESFTDEMMAEQTWELYRRYGQR